MRHIILMDPLRKLVIQKDSTCLFAISLKQAGHQVYILHEENFYFHNGKKQSLKVFEFTGGLDKKKTGYLSSFKLGKVKNLEVKLSDTFHMRLDPPFDSRYLKILWLLEYYESLGVKVINAPKGIMHHNEKILAYKYPKESLPSYVGMDVEKAWSFIKQLKLKELIFKPLDLFQGIGVKRVQVTTKKDFTLKFSRHLKKSQGCIVVQPFSDSIYDGEIRALYFQGKEIGSILKVPSKGQFLANIAQGADFQAIDLNRHQKSICDKISSRLKREKVPWVAFDIIGNKVSEVNITCPGLLVEISYAHDKNLAQNIIRLLP